MSLPSQIFDGKTVAAYVDGAGYIVLHRMELGVSAILSLSPEEWENLAAFVERAKK